MCENKLPTDRALGVTWDAQEDVFKFNALKQEPATTKRTILSQVFSVWDPRGLLLPFSIGSKIILQNLNRLKYGWDDGLKEADVREWCEWFKESWRLETVQILRTLFSRNELFLETILNVFCDASQDAYGASAHLRREFEDNVVECRLDVGKGRVVPLKAESICRLQLMGAVIAAC